jgi:hypothetical protein
MDKVKERLSPSLGRRLLTTPLHRLVWEIKNKKFEASDAMLRGNRWEYILHQGGLGGRHVWGDTKTRGVKFHAWAKDIEAEDYMIITAEEDKADQAFYEASRKHGLAKDLQNSRYQDHLERDDEHCYLDFLHIDTNTIYEMKAIKDSHKFPDTLFRNNYDLQAYMQMNLSNFSHRFAWLTVDTDAPYAMTVWKATPEVIESGRIKYEKARILFDAMNRGDYQELETHELEVPAWVLRQIS